MSTTDKDMKEAVAKVNDAAARWVINLLSEATDRFNAAADAFQSQDLEEEPPHFADPADHFTAQGGVVCTNFRHAHSVATHASCEVDYHYLIRVVINKADVRYPSQSIQNILSYLLEELGPDDWPKE